MVYDSARTRGCDVALPSYAKGLLTVDVNTQMSGLIQSAMRLRKLGHGQKLSIVLTPALNEKLGEVNVKNLVEFLAKNDEKHFKRNEFIASAFQAIRAVGIAWADREFRKSSSDQKRQFARFKKVSGEKTQELLMALIKTQNGVSANQFLVAVENISVESRLQAYKKQLFSWIKYYGYDPQSLEEEIDKIIADKVRICAETMLSMRASTDCQIESSQSVQVQQNVQTQHDLSFEKTLAFSQKAEGPLSFGRYPIQKLYLKATNDKIFISYDAFNLLKGHYFYTPNDKQQARIVRDCPFSHLFIEDDTVTIISAGEAAQEAFHEKCILTSDFQKMMESPLPLRQALYQTLIYLGQGLSLLQHLSSHGIQLPKAKQWAEESNASLTLKNLPILENMFDYPESKPVLEKITAENIKYALQRLNLSDYMASDVTIHVLSQALVNESRIYQEVQSTYAALEFEEKAMVSPRWQAYVNAKKQFYQCRADMISLLSKTKDLESFYHALGAVLDNPDITSLTQQGYQAFKRSRFRTKVFLYVLSAVLITASAVTFLIFPPVSYVLIAMSLLSIMKAIQLEVQDRTAFKVSDPSQATNSVVLLDEHSATKLSLQQAALSRNNGLKPLD